MAVPATCWIPAFAGMVTGHSMTQEFMSVHHPGQPGRGGRPDRKPGGVIPFLRKQESPPGSHSCESRNPWRCSTYWIPAFAGMVTGHSMTQEFMSVHHPGQPRRGGRPDRKPGGVIPFLRKQESMAVLLDSCFRRNGNTAFDGKLWHREGMVMAREIMAVPPHSGFLLSQEW